MHNYYATINMVAICSSHSCEIQLSYALLDLSETGATLYCIAIYSTSIAIFRLILLLNITPAAEHSSRVNDSITPI